MYLPDTVWWMAKINCTSSYVMMPSQLYTRHEKFPWALCRNSRIFTVIDTSNCYWDKKLEEESSLLCMFNTPFGRYKFNRLPFRICVVSDVVPWMVDDNFSDISGVITVHDDMIITGKDTAEHDSALKQVLESARSQNIKFNRSKVQLCMNQVKHLGDIVTADRFKPDPEKTKTIINMPEPQNKQDLQHLLGMVNYLLQYIPNMSEITAPFVHYLKRTCNGCYMTSTDPW